jgi:hypothetical protein
MEAGPGVPRALLKIGSVAEQRSGNRLATKLLTGQE